MQRLENLGADRLIYGTLEPPHPPARVISRLPSMLPFDVEPAGRHEFAVRPRDLRTFASDTGRRLARLV